MAVIHVHSRSLDSAAQINDMGHKIERNYEIQRFMFTLREIVGCDIISLLQDSIEKTHNFVKLLLYVPRSIIHKSPVDWSLFDIARAVQDYIRYGQHFKISLCPTWLRNKYDLDKL